MTKSEAIQKLNDIFEEIDSLQATLKEASANLRSILSDFEDIIGNLEEGFDGEEKDEE